MSQLRTSIRCVLFLTATLARPGHAALPPSVSDEFNGQRAPSFSIDTFHHGRAALSNFKGKVLLVSFFASWCPPCRGEITQLMELRRRYAAHGLTIFGAAVDAKMTPTPADQERADGSALVSRLEIPYPVGIATESFTRDYHFKGIPTTVVVGSDGRIVKTFYGYHPASRIADVIERILSKP